MAKANKLELDFVDTEPAKGVPAEYLKINPLGKIPSFEGADGYVLTEAIAIAIYSTCDSIVQSQTSTMMRNFINYSYPCLKTTVETLFTL